MAPHCIMPNPPIVIACFGFVCMNLAKGVNQINAIHYMCSNCGISCGGHKKTFASFAIVQFYKVMFYMHLVASFVYWWEHMHSTNVEWLPFRPRLCLVGRECSQLCSSWILRFSPLTKNFSDLGFSLTFNFLN